MTPGAATESEADPSGALLPGRCEFREQTARCVFVDGHPGCHVCVRTNGEGVPVRGEGDVPEDEYLWHLTTPSGVPTAEALRAQAWGHWTEGMVRFLVHELRVAGVEPPRDWAANRPRLRAEARAAGEE